MNKNKFYTSIIIVLVILNIFLLAFHFFIKPENNHDRKSIRPRDVIIQKLNFDDTQIEQYEKLISKHQQDIMQLDDEIFSLKGILYQQLNLEKYAIDSLTNEIAIKQVEVEKIHFNHLLDIKKLCKKEQLPAYHELTKEFSKIFLKLPNRRVNER